MIDLFRENRRAAMLISGSMLVLLIASTLSACQVEDLIKVKVPEGVAQAIETEPKIPVSETEDAWGDWQVWVERESGKFAKEIDKGNETAAIIRSLAETGIQIGQDAASTLPGGAFLSTALALTGGLFLRRPGDRKREQKEKEASFRAGLEFARDHLPTDGETTNEA